MRIDNYIYTILLILLAIIAIDALLIIAYVYTQDYPLDALTSALIIIPTIVLINLIVALILYAIKRKRLAGLLLFNSLLAPFIYNILSSRHYHFYRQRHFTTYRFIYKQHTFEIELEKDNHFYNFSDVTNQPHGSTDSFMGDYKISNDSIVLIDSTRHPIIFSNKLIGYPTITDTIQLKVK